MFARLILFLLLFVQFACSSFSGHDFKRQGERITRDLVLRLELINDREELFQALPHLKQLFDELAVLIIKAKKADEANKTKKNAYRVDPLWSRRLREEFERIYQMDGGRDLMEVAQGNALEKLNTFERELKGRRMTAWNR